MSFGLRDSAQWYFFDKTTNEVVMIGGYKNQDEINNLIRLRNAAKKKRLRKKLNKKIDGLLGR